MRVVTHYLADDGSQWDTEDEALNRDALCAEVAAAMAPLGPTTDRRHENGKAFIQHRAEYVLAAKRRIVKLCARNVDSKIFGRPAEQVHVHGIAGRILSEVGGPLAQAWYRLARIDEFAREWDQSYFALNPNTSAEATDALV